MSNGYDHDRIYEAGDLSAGRIEQAFLSFPSLKDPHAEAHTGEIISFAEYSPFQGYSTLPWKKRGVKYEEMKSRMAAAMLTFVERWHPGLRDLVEFAEVSTPLSVEHFTGFRDGAIYGLPASPERYRKRWLRPQTPVPGLYLTGADVSSLGIGGALMGGVFTTSSILGAASFPGIIKEALRS
jgi:phytoene dehydrogenase-like protein